MHCIDEYGVPDPSMTEIQVSNSTVLCKLLVRGWTVKNTNIVKCKLTSSDSVVFECKDNSSDAYTVTISENKTYVSQTNQKTVTVPFVCLPEQYTDDRTKLSESVITMQLLSVGGGGGGGGGSTSGSVTLKADDFNRAVLDFKNQVQLLSTVINQSNQSTTSAATTAADASQVAVATAAESAQSSSSTDSNLARTVQSLTEQVSQLSNSQTHTEGAALRELSIIVENIRQNNESTGKAIQGHTANFFRAMQRMEQLFNRVITHNQQFIDRLVSVRTPREAAHNAAAEAKQVKIGPSPVAKASSAKAEQNQASLISHEEIQKLANQINPTEKQQGTIKTKDTVNKKPQQHTVEPGHSSIPSGATAKQRQVVRDQLAPFFVEGRKGNLRPSANPKSRRSTLRREIQDAHMVFIDDPHKRFEHLTERSQYDVCVLLFSTGENFFFTETLLSSLPMYVIKVFATKPLIEKLGLLNDSSFVDYPYCFICPHDPTSEYSVDFFAQQTITTVGNKVAIQNLFDEHNAEETFASCLFEKAPVAPAPPAGDVPGAVAEASARSIGPPPVAPAPPAGDPPGAVAEANARSIGPLSLDDLPGPVGPKRAYSLEPNEKHNWQLGYNLYDQPVAKPFKPMLERCSAYEQFLIVEHLRTFYEIIGGKNKSKEVLKPSFEYALWFGATIMNDASVDALCEVYKNYETNAVDVATIGQVYTQFQTKIIKEYDADEQRKSNADIIRQQYETGKTRDAGAYMQSAMRKIRQNVEHEKARLAVMIAQDDHWDHTMEEDTRTAVSFLEDTDEIDSIDNIGLMGICQELLQEYNNRNTDEKTRRFILVRYKHALLHYKYDHF